MWNRPSGPVKLKADELNWALEHVTQYGDTVFLPTPFEYTAIRHDWKNVKSWLKRQDMVKWTSRPWRRFLATKSSSSFRYITQLDPIENLAFVALVRRLGESLERLRVPANQDVVFSWRFRPTKQGQMYDPSYSWSRFSQRCRECAIRASTKWVVVADIADFFAHIYFHPFEEALGAATSYSDDAYCLRRMIKNWNALVSYGLPVGLSGSRILAEATIHDVDEMLLAEGISYCRYSDDFRLFCSSEHKARRALEILASFLFERHGLTLQPLKTLVISAGEYLERFSISPERVEAESLSARFAELLEEAGVDLEDDYESEINYDDLDPDIQEQIDSLNLEGIFDEQMLRRDFDPVVVSHIFHRMAQLNRDSLVGPVLANMQKLHPVIDSAIRYLGAIRDTLDESVRKQIGAAILNTAKSRISSAYLQTCLLSLFTHGNEFDNEKRLERLFEHARDDAARRELMLALGRAGCGRWFQARRRDYANFSPWVRRAFFAAYSSVPRGTREHFYRSLAEQSDVLDRAILSWISVHPFS